MLEDHLRDRIDRLGPLRFSTFMEAALYEPTHGFYEGAGGAAGRRADFVTSPEVGPLFGAVMANALDGWWRAAGQPDVWVVVEVGAGPGTLARAVLSAEPACAAALRYVLVERSAHQRQGHGRFLALEEPSHAFAPAADDEETPILDDPRPPEGPIVVSLASLPRLNGPAVVLANELLDNLPFDLYRVTGGRWCELRVGTTEADDGLSFVAVPCVDLPAPLARARAALDPAAVGEGATVPVQTAAAAWVREVTALAGRGGRVVAIDYTSSTLELARRPVQEWVRTYRGHARGDQPLAAPGTQDITCEVAVDQLPTPTSIRVQAEWLAVHGLEDLVAEGRQGWTERAAVGDLAAVRARSRVTEAAALVDPGGLGGFRVLEWLT